MKIRMLLVPFLAPGLFSCTAPGTSPDPTRAIGAVVLVRSLPYRPPAGVDPHAAPGTGFEAPIDPAMAAREVARALREDGLFTQVFLDEGPNQPGEKGPRAASVCEVSVGGKGFAPENSEIEAGMAALSSFVWFMTIVPAWWIPDRVYPGSDVVVRAKFNSGGGTGRPGFAVSLSIGPQELALIDRGATWQYFLSLVAPTFWMDDDRVAADALRQGALRMIRSGFAAEVRRSLPPAIPAAGR